MIPNLKKKSYEERLNIFNITALETRTLRGDIIEIFKICKGFDITEPSLFFTFSTAPTRGRTLKLVKPRSHLDNRKFSFAHRVIDTWNSLDESIIACNSINGFKNRIDKFLNGLYGLYKLYRKAYLTLTSLN